MGNLDEQFIKDIVASVKCTSCGKPYDKAGITVLSRHEDTWFVSVSCSSCHTRGLVAAVVKQGKAPEIISDLTPGEAPRFSDRGPVEANDVLNMHYYLDGFDGDFLKLFGKPNPGS